LYQSRRLIVKLLALLRVPSLAQFVSLPSPLCFVVAHGRKLLVMMPTQALMQTTVNRCQAMPEVTQEMQARATRWPVPVMRPVARSFALARYRCSCSAAHPSSPSLPLAMKRLA
jgi:hypothetical protein